MSLDDKVKLSYWKLFRLYLSARKALGKEVAKRYFKFAWAQGRLNKSKKK